MKNLKFYVKAIFAYLYVHAKYAFIKLIEFVKSEPSKTFWDRVARNTALVLLTMYVLGRLALPIEIIDKIYLLVLIECVAIGMSIFATYVIGRIKFTKVMIYGDDNSLDSNERSAYLNLFGKIILAVHFLIGCSWANIQFIERLH